MSSALRRRLAMPAGLIVGYGLDQMLGDPRRWHPVAGYGQAAEALERRLYADDRLAGVVFTTVAVAIPVLAAAAVGRLARRSPAVMTALAAAATWTVLGGRSLAVEADAVAAELDADDLRAARRQVARLVGRDTETLDECGVARAAIESVAENTADAVVAPMLWGAVAGLPGLLGYRAVNTLDAMVGHRSARYERFGWAAARLDDVANWVPARIATALTVAASPVVGGTPRRTLAALGDARAHPSPNAGWVEAAFAGALEVRLGGRNAYAGVVSDRGTLGDGRPPRGSDVGRANRLAAAVGGAALALCVIMRLIRS